VLRVSTMYAELEERTPVDTDLEAKHKEVDELKQKLNDRITKYMEHTQNREEQLNAFMEQYEKKNAELEKGKATFRELVKTKTDEMIKERDGMTTAMYEYKVRVRRALLGEAGDPLIEELQTRINELERRLGYRMSYRTNK